MQDLLATTLKHVFELKRTHHTTLIDWALTSGHDLQIKRSRNIDEARHKMT